jgi:hypothetical protein
MDAHDGYVFVKLWFLWHAAQTDVVKHIQKTGVGISNIVVKGNAGIKVLSHI